MSNQINSIFWKLRENKQTLNILCDFYNEKVLYDLSKTGHNFFVLPPNSKYEWNNLYRKKPDNICLLKKTEELFFNFTEYAFDLFINFANKSKGIVFHLGIPKLDNKDFIGIDTDLFSPSEDKNDLCIYVNGGFKFDVNEFDLVSEQLELVVVDDNTRLSFNKLLNLYKTSSIYLNFSKEEKISISMLEAMSCGCVPIAYGTKENQKIITHGENGFLYTSVVDMVNITKRVLGSKDFLKRMSINSRNSIIKSFSFEDYKKNWNECFYSTIEMNWWEIL